MERLPHSIFDGLLIMPPVRVKVLPNYAGPTDVLLSPAREDDVGVDIYAAEDASLAPGQRAIIGTGMIVAVQTGYEAQVRPRSGNAAKLGLTVLNTPGTIDPTYRGEIGVIAYNSNPLLTLEDLASASDPSLSPLEEIRRAAESRIIKIQRGDRIAQLVFAKYERPIIVAVTILDGTTRGSGGFGSTGT